MKKPTTTAPLTWGEAIRRARTERGLSQGALAPLLGVSRNAVVDWERNAGEIQEINKAALRQFFGSDLIEPKPAPSERTMGYLHGQANQVASLLRFALSQQEELAADMLRASQGEDTEIEEAKRSVARDAARVARESPAVKPAPRKKHG